MPVVNSQPSMLWPLLLLVAGALPGLASTIDVAALDRLFARAEEKESNALFVYQRGTPLREKFFGTRDRKIQLYSVTKVFTGLAVGIAWDRGLIPSIEEPVASYFPELKDDPRRRQLRIRHLLQHTSGIFTTKGSQDIYPQRDFVKFALESELVAEPGLRFQYNNRAINIVPGIIRRATGKSMEEFLAEHLFAPLEIRDYSFRRDKAGNTWGQDGLQMKISDLIKVACVLADEGRWRGRQIVSKEWLAVASQGALIRLTEPSQTGLGLFVNDVGGGALIPEFTMDALAQGGLAPVLAERLRPLAGREFATTSQLGGELHRVFTPAELEQIAAAAGRLMVPAYTTPRRRPMISHSGEVGVILIAMPDEGLAVARTIDDARGRNKPNGFEEIYTLVYQLTPREPK